MQHDENASLRTRPGRGVGAGPGGARPRVLMGREQAEPLAGMLRAWGAAPVHVPMVELGATRFPPPHGRPDLLLVSSAATVRFAPQLAALGAPAVAVGPATAAALQAIGVAVIAQGAEGGAAAVSLLQEHRTVRGGGGMAWFVGAARPSAELQAALVRLPAESWRHWPVYDNQPADGLAARLEAVGPVDAVVLTSGTMATAWVHAGGPVHAAQALRIALGESTRAALVGVGWPPHAVSVTPTLPALAVACAAALGFSSGGTSPG